MAEPTPAKTKSKVEMNSATYALMEAALHESSKRPKAIPGIFFFFFQKRIINKFLKKREDRGDEMMIVWDERNSTF